MAPQDPAEEKKLFLLSDGSFITEERLKNGDRETKLDAMRTWFHGNFQDPANETSYNSAEGGYLYMYGGPYETREVLEDRFADFIDEDVIDEIEKELGEGWEWEGRPGPDSFDYDDYLFDAIEPGTVQKSKFSDSITFTRRLLTTNVNYTEEQHFRRLLFVGVVTALEAYLSDRFINAIEDNPKARRRFVETYSGFERETISLRRIFEHADGIDERVRSILMAVVWHRLDEAHRMFKATFDVDLKASKVLDDLKRAINVRHDLVHRGGKTKDGKEHMITPENIEKLIEHAGAVVECVEGQKGRLVPEKPLSVGTEAIAESDEECL